MPQPCGTGAACGTDAGWAEEGDGPRGRDTNPTGDLLVDSGPSSLTGRIVSGAKGCEPAGLAPRRGRGIEPRRPGLQQAQVIGRRNALSIQTSRQHVEDMGWRQRCSHE